GGLAVLREMHPDVTLLHADLSRRGDWALQFDGADAVVMLHAQIGGKHYARFQENNIDATAFVLEAMQQHGVPYLVHVSSSVVNSVVDDWYTQTKRAQEQQVLSSGIAHVILRPTLMFGWFDRKHLGWLSRFMHAVPVFPIPGHGRYLRQPLYAGDFCNIIASCIARRSTGAFNISGQENVDYIDLVREVRRATQARTMLLRLPYWLFHSLLRIWSVFDSDPPFTTQQLAALVAGDSFEVIDWPTLFQVRATPLAEAIHETFNDPQYARFAQGPEHGG
ncbi:MAG: NAD-dependent epimerase/dehydratase family protein, partial [Pseudomonadota bacterium]